MSVLLQQLSAYSPLTLVGALLALCALSYLLLIVVIRPYQFASDFKRQGVPGYSYKFPLGNVREFFARYEVGEDNSFFSVSTKKFGRLFYYFMGPFPRLGITDPDCIQDVLSKKADMYCKEGGGAFAKLLLNDGLLISEGVKWKYQRQLINPAFHFAHLKSLVEIMQFATNTALDKWSQDIKANGNNPIEVEINGAMSHIALDAIASAAFGSTFRDDPKLAATTAKCFMETLAEIFKVFSSARANIPLVKLLPNSAKKKIDQSLEEMRVGLFRIVEERKNGKNVPLCSSGKDLLQLLLDARDENGQPMSDHCVHANLLTFILAGHDTTSNWLTWALYMFAQRPEDWEKCRQEVKDVLNGEPVMTYDHLKNMKYLEAFLDEALRMFGPVRFLTRMAIADHTIGSEARPVHIKAGTVVNMDFRTVHRDKELWGPDAEEFNPERFLDKHSAKRHPAAFLPFSIGPRQCIGQNFSRFEGKVIVASMMQRFNLSVVPGQKIGPTVFFMRPAYGIRIYVAPIDA